MTGPTPVVPAIDLHLAHPLDVVRRRRAGERRVLTDRFLPDFRTAGLLGVVQRCGGDITGPGEPDDPLESTLQQIDAVQAELAESEGAFVLVREPGDWPDAAGGPVGLMIALEGVAPLGGSLDVLDRLERAGLRSVQLTWNGRNEAAAGVAVEEEPLGLTEFGRACVRRLNELGLVIDVAHLAPEGIDEVIELSVAPVVNTHANAKAVCGHRRNLDDERILAIAGTGGLVGVTAYGEFIDAEAPSVERLLDHLDHIVGLVGAAHVGLGSDIIDYAADLVAPALDAAKIYGSAYSYAPDLQRVEQLPAVWSGLSRRGYSDADIVGIAGGNFRRVFAEVRARRSTA